MQRNPSLDLTKFIRGIPDFPKPGILFRDITPLLGNTAAFRETIARMADPFRGQKIDCLVAAEARGFIFAAPLAIELEAAFVPVRKPGKLHMISILLATYSSMVATRWRCIKTVSQSVSEYWSSMTCWRRVGPLKHAANCCPTSRSTLLAACSVSN